MIMIHGTPLDEEYPEWYFHTLDWTEGCIAMRNADMREVWSLVQGRHADRNPPLRIYRVPAVRRGKTPRPQRAGS